MQEDLPSRTALRVAMRRAAHQVLDRPLVLDDPFAIRVLPSEAAQEVLEADGREHQPVPRALRAFMVARSRFAEDELRDAVGRGVSQYVLLGAGLDTFAWRNPGGVQVFEVDHPATQGWKRSLVAESALGEPPAVTYVPVDFERQSLAGCLESAGLRISEPVFFSWLGVTPYLTLEAFRSTLSYLGTMSPGSGIVFDYAAPRESLSEPERIAFDFIASRVAEAGEPFQTFFTPEQIAAELASVGWRVHLDLHGTDLEQRFFADRADGLTVRSGAGHLLSARN